MHTPTIADVLSHAEASPRTIKPLQLPPKHLLSLLPCPNEGGPFPETPSNKIFQGCYWLLSFLGFLQSKCWLLSVSPSLPHSIFSCLFLKIKVCKEICCSQQPHSQMRRLFQLWTTRQRIRKSNEHMFLSATIVDLVMNGFITDQSVFPSAFVVVITLLGCQSSLSATWTNDYYTPDIICCISLQCQHWVCIFAVEQLPLCWDRKQRHPTVCRLSRYQWSDGCEGFSAPALARGSLWLVKLPCVKEIV